MYTVMREHGRDGSWEGEQVRGIEGGRKAEKEMGQRMKIGDEKF